ncbi:hypothetical protein F5Y16DRAFT_247698 [Xylariaceae sp. FL0255]|nr:hypothetical protein F5Y16DRAFT_247698 [Xylariaceae sp. FL0255]
MEQSDTVDELKSVPSSTQTGTASSSPPQTPRLANSEPNCHTSLTEPEPLLDLNHSVPSLRFPRPLGNRQLTNWVSTSSHDIMQPPNSHEDDLSLSDLGYDVIGTDGESQAESTTSSVDYQRPDDVQSLVGTDIGTDIGTDLETNDDADTDSSDDDETFIEGAPANEMQETEAEMLANQRLDNPSVSSFDIPSLSYLESLQHRTHLPAELNQSEDADVSEPEEATPAEPSDTQPVEPPKQKRWTDILRDEIFTTGNIYQYWRILFTVFSVTTLCMLAVTGKSLFMSSSFPKELSTVPVASVSSMVSPQPHSGSSVLDIVPSPTSTQSPNALQTINSSTGLSFIPFGKEKPHTDIIISSPSPVMCSADLSGRNEITVRIPHNLKTSWLAKDAILIAISRGRRDIITNVTSVDEGFLIEVPLSEAHGLVTVTIATTKKPLISESFRINFGTHRLTEALDAGKQLVRDFAQIFVDTVNETTSWVEEAYHLPALDTMSKQVCEQTYSVSGLLLQNIREGSNIISEIPRRIVEQVQQMLDQQSMVRHVGHVQREMIRHALDARDELGMVLLRGQLRSKLLWLKLQGKTEEHDYYLQKAEAYWKEQKERTASARLDRAKETQAPDGMEQGQEKSGVKGFFWTMMGEA